MPGFGRQRKPLDLKPRGSTAAGLDGASGGPPAAPGSSRPPTPPQPSADAAAAPAAPAAGGASPAQQAEAETRCKSLVTEYSQLKSDSEAIAAFQVRLQAL